MKPPMLAGRSHVGVLKIVSMASQTGGVNKSQSASAGARRAQHGLSAAEPFTGALDGFSRGSIIRRSFVSLDHLIGERDELVRHGKPAAEQCDEFPPRHVEHAASSTLLLARSDERTRYSALTLAARITLPHFSVSSAMSLANSELESESGVSPSSAIRRVILESASARLISWFSLLMISAGVARGATIPT